VVSVKDFFLTKGIAGKGGTPRGNTIGNRCKLCKGDIKKKKEGNPLVREILP